MNTFLCDFLKYLEVERHYSTHTVLAYNNDLGKFISFLKSRSITSIKEIDRKILREFLSELYEQGLHSKSISRVIACLKSFFKFCNRIGVVDGNPAQLLVSPKVGKKLPVHLNEQVINGILNSIPNETISDMRDKAILELFYGSGIRLGELCSLSVNSVDYLGRTIKVSGKGKKQRIVPIGNKAMEAIQIYIKNRDNKMNDFLKQNAPLFLSKQDKRLSREMVTLIVKKYINRFVDI